MILVFWLCWLIVLGFTSQDGYESPYEDNISRIHPYWTHHFGVNTVQESQIMNDNVEINEEGINIYTTFTSIFM